MIAAISVPAVQAHAATEVSVSSVPDISAELALSSLISMSDAHLEKMADSLKILARNPLAESGDWKKIREPLQQAAKLNVDAVNWFASPDGAYWTLQEGRAPGRLSDRPYFPKLLAGKTVIGDLVVSRSTGKSSAIVAVPIFGKSGKVVGALGASIDLEKLSRRLRQELGFTESMIYYSFDSTPLIGINWNPSLILADPNHLGQDVSQAIAEMMKRDEGAESYAYLGRTRSVIFRRSSVTGWWYAFGTAQG